MLFAKRVFFFAGITEFVRDRNRGLFTNQALRSRLEAKQFAQAGLRDFSGPVIQLENLSPEDLYVLFLKIRHIVASGDASKYLVPDEAVGMFIAHCSRTLGADCFQTPRDSVRAFVNFLLLLDQNPDADWRKVLAGTKVEASSDRGTEFVTDEEAPQLRAAANPRPASQTETDDLKKFKL